MRYPPHQENLRAPQSGFRVIGVEGVSGTYIVGDFTSLEAAVEAANGRAGIGAPVYVYDDAGKMLVRLGSWH